MTPPEYRDAKQRIDRLQDVVESLLRAGRNDEIMSAVADLRNAVVCLDNLIRDSNGDERRTVFIEECKSLYQNS